jgi:hypothetical protein
MQIDFSINVNDGSSQVKESLKSHGIASWNVEYISIFCHVPEGQSVQCMIDTGSGGVWFPMIAQGTFAGFDDFVSSGLVSFQIGATGLESFNMVRSSSSGQGTVNVMLVGAPESTTA